MPKLTKPSHNSEPLPKRAFTKPTVHKSTASHRQTHALLLHWTEDDIGVEPQLSLLAQVFSGVYQFTSILTCSIPSDDSQEFVRGAMTKFLERWGRDRRNLLVVYYSGHGEIDGDVEGAEGAGGLKWCAFKKKPGDSRKVPELSWTRIQQSLSQCPSDVLLILDSCASASSIPITPSRVPTSLITPKASPPNPHPPSSTSSNSKATPPASTVKPPRQNTIELLAACGFETTSPGLGPSSFFHLLLTELCSSTLIRREFSVAELHRRILGQAAARGGECRSPLYVRMQGETKGGSICVGGGLDVRRAVGEGKRILGELEGIGEMVDREGNGGVDGEGDERKEKRPEKVDEGREVRILDSSVGC